MSVSAASRVVRVAGIRVDLVSQELWRRGRPVRLQEKPFLVLEALIERPGEVVTRNELQRRLWPDGTVVDFANSLNSAVASLRAALRDSARAPRVIETLPRIGYRLVAPVEAETPADGPAQAPLRPFVVRAQRTAPVWSAVLAGLVLAAAVPFVNRLLSSPTETRALDPSTSPTQHADPKARAAWQRGIYLLERDRLDDLEQALAAFDEAASIDPGFADAYARRADTLMRMSFGGRLPVHDGLTGALEAAKQAVTLDDANSTAHRILASTHLHLKWDLDAAAGALDRAFELNPDDPHTRLTAASWLLASGRYDAAVEAARRAVELDPGSHFVRADLGWFLLIARRYEETIAACNESLAVEPGFTPVLRFLVDAHAALGQDDLAVAAASRLMRAANVDEQEITAILDRPVSEALAAYRRWLLEWAGNSASHFGLALRHAAAGNHDVALEHLQQAYADREPFLIYLRCFRELDVLLADPRLEQLAERFGTPSASDRRVRLFSGSGKV